MEVLQQADVYKARLQKALQAKGGAPPAAPAPSELGWGAVALPHPVAWSVPSGAGAKELQKLSRQVRVLGVWGGERGVGG